MQKIREAFSEYVDRFSAFPTPSCIRNLILPPLYMDDERDHYIESKIKAGMPMTSIAQDYRRAFGFTKK